MNVGYNATVIVMVDALDAIEGDANFGKNLKQAVQKLTFRGTEHFRYGMGDIAALGHVNAATAIEMHHADSTVVVAVGGNMGAIMHQSYGCDHHTDKGKERLLREMADALGFRLVKKAQRK